MTRPPSTTRTAPGVIPDEVIRDERSSGFILHIRLADDVAIDSRRSFMSSLTDALDELTDGTGGGRSASVAVGFGKRFFTSLPISPAGFDDAPLPAGELIDADIALYIMYNAEWRLGEFLERLATLGSGIVASVVSHAGFQRTDRRELGRFLDGLRNPKAADRAEVVFVDRDRNPEEPVEAEGGTYMTTMRVLQDLAAWNALAVADQERMIGRRKDDGSRLDLAAGTAIVDETTINGASCPFNSHVAKLGPRGEHNDAVRIFRRGIPFINLTPTGTVEAGLLFVAFHNAMSPIRTMVDDWMLNPDFPTPGTGQDALLENHIISITHTGFYFVPSRVGFYGAQFFEGHQHDERCLGHVAVHKRVLDASGSPIRAERGGFTFQLFDGSNNPASDPFTTDSSGRALSPAVPVGNTYILREISSRTGFDPAPDLSIDLSGHRALATVDNHATATNPGYR